MKGIIILEGGDGTGKTTLARHLVNYHGAFYIHNGIHKNMWRRHLGAVHLATTMAQRGLVVIDRLWLSEQVYGQVFRSGPSYNLGARCLDRVLQRFGALTVLCVRKDLRKHVAHFDKLKMERPEKFNNMARIAQTYYDLLEGNLAHPGKTYLDQLIKFQDYKARVDVASYDMDREGHDLRNVTEKLMNHLKLARDEELHGQYDATRANLTGHYGAAHYLFVGEGLSPQVRPDSWPFVWSDEASAATWLNGMLHDLKFDETHGMFVNALTRGDTFLEQMQSRRLRVIALGNTAADRVQKLGFTDVRVLPHPQWARRFQYREPEIYRNALRDALHVR